MQGMFSAFRSKISDVFTKEGVEESKVKTKDPPSLGFLDYEDIAAYAKAQKNNNFNSKTQVQRIKAICKLEMEDYLAYHSYFVHKKGSIHPGEMKKQNAIRFINNYILEKKGDIFATLEKLHAENFPESALKKKKQLGYDSEKSGNSRSDSSSDPDKHSTKKRGDPAYSPTVDNLFIRQKRSVPITPPQVVDSNEQAPIITTTTTAQTPAMQHNQPPAENQGTNSPAPTILEPPPVTITVQEPPPVTTTIQQPPPVATTIQVPPPVTPTIQVPSPIITEIAPANTAPILPRTQEEMENDDDSFSHSQMGQEEPAQRNQAWANNIQLGNAGEDLREEGPANIEPQLPKTVKARRQARVLQILESLAKNAEKDDHRIRYEAYCEVQSIDDTDLASKLITRNYKAWKKDKKALRNLPSISDNIPIEKLSKLYSKIFLLPSNLTKTHFNLLKYHLKNELESKQPLLWAPKKQTWDSICAKQGFTDSSFDEACKNRYRGFYRVLRNLRQGDYVQIKEKAKKHRKRQMGTRERENRVEGADPDDMEMEEDGGAEAHSEDGDYIVGMDLDKQDYDSDLSEKISVDSDEVEMVEEGVKSRLYDTRQLKIELKKRDDVESDMGDDMDDDVIGAIDDIIDAELLSDSEDGGSTSDKQDILNQ